MSSFRQFALALGASVLLAAVPATGVATASASSGPVAHAARHKKHKKKHKKHRRHHHHATATKPTTAAPAPAPAATPSPAPAATPAAPAIPLGGYQCYSTSQVVGIGAGYYSHAAQLITLNADGTYQVANLGSYVGNNHWNQQGTTINFTSGPLWDDVSHTHDQGTWYPDGVSMPNAGTNVPSGGYTLVIRDTVQEGGIPPSVEYSSTDGSGGGSSQPQSFEYCQLKYPA